MNYLAHILLAQHSEEAMLGALLGDFVKANMVGQYPPEVEAEIMMHRKVDVYTDSHPIVKDAVQTFGDGRRRYAGIVLDVFYDHLLAKNWSRYSAVPLDVFVQRFYTALGRHENILPVKLVEAMPRMIAQDWLGSYRDFSGVEVAVNRTSQRLSRNGHLLREGLLDLQANYSALEDGFHLFFPELMQFVKQARSELDGYVPGAAPAQQIDTP